MLAKKWRTLGAELWSLGLRFGLGFEGLEFERRVAAATAAAAVVVVGVE